jgi:ornithine carbamoyltransferase
MNKDFLSIADLSPGELEDTLKLAASLKSGGSAAKVLEGKCAALLFEKPSLRTRLSFEVGVAQLGGTAVYLGKEEVGLGGRESVEDVARVISRFVSLIIVRTFSQELLERLASAAEVPVINALTDSLHPCQIVSDLLTIKELRGELGGQVVAYVGDGNNVANSWLNAVRRSSFVLRMATPAECGPGEELEAAATKEAAGRMFFTRDPAEAVSGADVVYTDVWVSMGDAEKAEEKKQLLANYQVNAELLSHARPDHIVMHCLPAKRGEEITDEVLDGPQSVVLVQAENRLHGQKALMVRLLGG